jgi:hypothetical protein
VDGPSAAFAVETMVAGPLIGETTDDTPAGAFLW